MEESMDWIDHQSIIDKPNEAVFSYDSLKSILDSINKKLSLQLLLIWEEISISSGYDSALMPYSLNSSPNFAIYELFNLRKLFHIFISISSLVKMV